MVDFKRNKDGIAARVERIEYDPNRSAHLALLLYADGERRYILAPKGLGAGDEVMSGREAPDQDRQLRCLYATCHSVRPFTASS